MASTSGEKELKTKWPVEKGLIAKTTKQTGRVMNLIPEGILGVKTIVSKKDKELLDKQLNSKEKN